MASHLRVGPGADSEPDDDVARQSPAAEPTGDRGARLALAAFMVGTGVMHFVVPRGYARIVPRWLGDRRRVVRASGVAELACGSPGAAERRG